MPRRTFEQMRFTFQHCMNLQSEWSILYRMAVLTGISVVWYDCCINSCVCYAGALFLLQKCPHCQEDRYNEHGQPHHRFGYLPLIPHLQAFFQSKKQVKLMSYQAKYRTDDSSISDVFDAIAYQTLCKRNITIDDQEYAPQDLVHNTHNNRLSRTTKAHCYRFSRHRPAYRLLL